MRRIAVLKAFMLASALLAAPAAAEIRIIQSPGGQVGPFLDLFEKVRESGERVVIDGPCLSACTLVLSIVPGERICVTKRAVLGFHAARSVDRHGRFYAEPEASVACVRSPSVYAAVTIAVLSDDAVDEEEAGADVPHAVREAASNAVKMIADNFFNII